MKSSLKRILACVLAVVLLVSLAACGSGDTTSTTAAAGGSSASGGETPAAQTPDKEYPTIKVMMSCLNVPKDVAMVEEALSAITREKIGANVELIMMEYANQTQQLNMLLAAGDDSIDIFYVRDIATTIGLGQALDITDLIAPYVDSITEKIGADVFKCSYQNDRCYGVPRLLDMASTATFSLPASIAAEFGYKNGDQISLDGLDDLFAKVHAAYPDIPIIGPNNGTCVFADTRVDQIGTSSYYLGVLNDYGQSSTVVNYFESPEFLEIMEHVELWNKSGYYMTDVLNVTEAPIDLIPARRCLGCFASHFSAEMNGIWQSDNFGEEMACLSIYENAFCKTPTTVFCVNPATKSPEEAVGMLALMATDPEVVNLMINGIEGVHYQVLEDGSATYADGVDASNVGWCIGYSWANLNSTLSIPFNYPADYYDQMIASNTNALKSNAFGFKLDTSNITDEIAACTNVYNQYYKALFSDAVDDYPEMIKTLQDEMKAAGIEKIVAEKQAQLDAFLGK